MFKRFSKVLDQSALAKEGLGFIKHGINKLKRGACLRGFEKSKGVTCKHLFVILSMGRV